MLSLSNLTKSYRTATVETTALAGVDLTIEQGDFVAIMGPSGCGKSTLLNILGMLDAPDSGSYRFLGQEVAGAPQGEVAALRKRHLGFVFQSFNLIEDLSVAENVELPLLYQRVARAERRRRVAQAMEEVGLGHRAGHRPSQLSGGQQQRVAVARAVVTRPAIILADEPTGNLDSIHGEEVMRLLAELSRAGTTVVMVTHSTIDAAHATRTIRLLDGRVVTQSATRGRPSHHAAQPDVLPC
jgi:putative ABC transport system ATP-binding protein